MVKLGKSTNFLFMKRINTGKSHSRHRFHADAVWKQGVSCVSDIHWTHGGVELRKGGTIREKVRNKGMNDRRIKFGKVGYDVYYRKRFFFSYSMYMYTYIVEFLLYMKSCRINLFIGLSLDIPPRVNWVKYYKILMKIAMAPSCGNLLSNFTSRVTQKSLKCPKNLFRLFLHAWNVNMLLSIMN